MGGQLSMAEQRKNGMVENEKWAKTLCYQYRFTDQSVVNSTCRAA